MDLLQLQNLCKRDSESYREDFQLQYRHYQTQLQLFKLKPNKESHEFEALINFLSHVAPVYKKELVDFPQQIIALLDENYSALEPGLRRTLAKALILMRNRDLLSPTTLLCLFFKLFRCKDKPLRQMLYSHIVMDIKNINEKHKNQKMNRTLQNFMYTMLNDPSDIAAKKSLDVMIDLYRKRIWNDAKTVNVISQGCFSKFSKVKVDAIQFFLSAESTEIEEEDDMVKKYSTHANKTKKRERLLKKGIKKAQKLQHKEKDIKVNFPAIELLNDPQGFAEKLLADLKHSTERFEVKMMIMNLISRLIGCHKLLLLNFYTWVQRYLKPQQQNITQILAIVAQSSHDLVPPDSLEEVIRVITNHFVNEHGAAEATSIGLNTIREICNRQPNAISDKELLRELTSYKKNHDKGIMMASRSIIALYRNVNPGLLPKNDRGKFADMTIEPTQYGELRPADQVKDVELLEDKEGEDDDSDGWVNVSDGEGEWVKVEDEDGEADSDDDAEGEWVETDNEEESDDDEDEEEEGGEEEEEEGEEVEDVEDEDGEADGADEDEAAWFVDKTPSTVTAGGDEAENADDMDEALPKEENAARADLTRLLTSEDFEKMKRKREALDEDKDSDSDSDSARPAYQVDPTDITGFQKKRKLDKEGRLASVMAGREGREKFGRKKAKHGQSHTNKDTAKAQPYQLTRHSAAVRAKAKVSLKDKVRQRKKRKGRRGNSKLNGYQKKRG